MDRLVAVFSVYDFFSYVITGGVVIVGAWWAIAGVPAEPGAAVAFALIAASYVVGHLVQALARFWVEKLWWKCRRGWPSNFRLSDSPIVSEDQEQAKRPWQRQPYDDRFKAFLHQGLARHHGPETADLATRELFALARADLRAWGADGRAELMNTLYAFSRGLTMASLILTVTFAVAALEKEAWEPFGWATLATAASTALFAFRFDNFGHRFADQVWHDYAALAGRHTKER